MSALEKFRQVLETDERYSPQAYNFVYEALDWTLKNVTPQDDEDAQHVTGAELLEGIRQYTIHEFGCLARTVLESWGVTQTGDIGELVFNLVEHDLMGKQDSDTKEDFRDVYDFSEVFDLAPRFYYRADHDEWQTEYVERVGSDIS